MADHDEDPPRDPVWIDLWDSGLNKYAVAWIVAAIGMWILIQLLTP